VALQVSNVGEQIKVLMIDSEHLNFADDQKTQQELIDEVLLALPKG